MRGIYVAAGRPYKVLVGKGALKETGRLIKQTAPDVMKVLVVTDSHVAPLFLEDMRKSLASRGLEVYEYIVEAGEQNKNIASIAGMWGVMASAQFTRTDAVVAMGGGVVTDMGGFAAATFLRGIKVFQVPTSLLAMVDAAVGGKTGIDLKEGKNLVGSFWQPSLVLEDPECLKTLPQELFAEGMGEVIKHAFIMDTELYDLLKDGQGDYDKLRQDDRFLEDLVYMNVRDKVSVIVDDECDNGKRQTLNFGHTIGHVIERDNNFTLAHGVCVAKGMGLIIDASESDGILDPEEAQKMRSLIKTYDLPCEDDITPEDIVAGAMNDKKKRGDTLSIILVDRIGNSLIRKMTPDEFLTFLEAGQSLRESRR